MLTLVRYLQTQHTGTVLALFHFVNILNIKMIINTVPFVIISVVIKYYGGTGTAVIIKVIISTIVIINMIVSKVVKL
jgi:hypothetical protein